MGKGKAITPWDDSALVDAFDRAVASFKEAHLQAGVSADDEAKTTPAAVYNKDESANCNILEEVMYQDDKEASKAEIQREEETIKENNDIASYDELLKHYYELEEKRQTLLQQLYAHPAYYDQTMQAEAYDAAPEHASQDPQYLNPACVGCCLPVSVVPVTGGNSCGPCNPCSSICQICDKCPDKYAGCSAAVPCSTDLTTQSRDMDHSTDLKKGIMVAETAMRSINASISAKESEPVGINESLQSIGISDADLLPVLNAWYSAGFHTARYMLEKSRQNNS